MNFKLTNMKAIVSIIAGIVLGYLISSLYRCVGNCNVDFEALKTVYFVLISLVSIAIIYIIWSLIQKKS